MDYVFGIITGLVAGIAMAEVYHGNWGAAVIWAAVLAFNVATDRRFFQLQSSRKD